MGLRDTVERIVEALGEHDAQAREQIVAVVAALGETAALELLDETLIIEQAGGTPVAAGSRRRTAGGVFFHLARRWLPLHERKRIFSSAPTAIERRGDARGDATPANEPSSSRAVRARARREPVLDRLETEVSRLADSFAISLVPLLREAMLDSLRHALRSANAQTAVASDRSLRDPASASTSPSTKAVEVRPRRRLARARTSEPHGSVQKRVLEMLAARPGMTAAQLAIALYGEDDPRAKDRVKAVTWRLRGAGIVRGVGSEGFTLVDGAQRVKASDVRE